VGGAALLEPLDEDVVLELEIPEGDSKVDEVTDMEVDPAIADAVLST
jgi:hypothetical protein